MSLFKKAMVEFIGTLVLVFLGCGTAVVCSKYINVGISGYIVATAFSFGLAYLAMSITLGEVSGCQLSPAISIAMFFKKKITFLELVIYILIQMLGASIGALLLAFCFKADFKNLGASEIQTILLTEGKLNAWSYISAFILELTTAGIITMVYLALYNDNKHSCIAKAIGIGLTITATCLLTVGLTGSITNPAASFGPGLLQAFAGNTKSLQQFWIWLIAPLLGSTIATFVYSILTAEDEYTM